TIYEVDQENDMPFLAMEFLEGESLESRLQRERKLPLPEVLQIGRQVAEGLAAAHDRQLVHRDIKPANLFLEIVDCRLSIADLPRVTSAIRVKLLDFGLARAQGGQANLTATGLIVGTPRFMSPEQARGQQFDYRSDLFSLGSVLHLMCSGEFA